MKEISSIDFPQHGEVFYFYGQALDRLMFKTQRNPFFTLFDKFVFLLYDNSSQWQLFIIYSVFVKANHRMGDQN
jgi:hypothetical protein